MNPRRDTILPECINREALCKASTDLMILEILEYHGLYFQDIAIPSRKRELVDIRHIVNYFLTVKEELSLQYIASIFDMDHSSVINSRKVVECMIETDKNWNSKIIEIANLIINFQQMKNDDVSTDVLKYALTSTAWTGEILITYNKASLLVNLDISNANLSENQHVWFLKNMPRELAELQKLVSTLETLTLTQVELEVTFDMFWNKYNEKIRSSKKKSLTTWNRLPKAERMKAYNFINKYDQSILPGTAKKYAETYLNSEIWNN